MKKYLKLITFSILSGTLLVACSNQNDKIKINNEPIIKNEQNKELKIVNEKTFVYKQSDEPVIISSTYGAEIKNEGKKPIDVNNVIINFNGHDDQPISHFEFIESVPNIINPGETGFILQQTILSGIIAENGLKEVKTELYGEETKEKQVLLDVIDVSVEESNNQVTPYIVKGKVINNSGSDIGGAKIYAGLYDDKGTFYGIMTGTASPVVEPMKPNVALKDNGEITFELTFPTLSNGIKGKVTTAKVYAISYDYVKFDPIENLKNEIKNLVDVENIPPHIIDQIKKFKDEDTKQEFLNSIENEKTRKLIKDELNKKPEKVTENKNSESKDKK